MGRLGDGRIRGSSTRLMRLFGRELETRRIDSVLDSARVGRSRVLILRGAPGIGKTALLRYASERAEGMTVLRARGLEVEALLALCLR